MSSTHTLQRFDRTKTVGIVAGLLVNPDYQANVLRIEELIKHLISECQGVETPTISELEWHLNSFPPVSEVTHREDPIEDVFVSKVLSKWGEFRIYGGIWEGFNFYLQQVLTVIESIPEELATQTFLAPIRALLRISEEIAKRNAAVVNLIGGGVAAHEVKLRNEEEVLWRGNTLLFSRADLRALDCSVDDLLPFVLDTTKYISFKDIDGTDPSFTWQPLIDVNGSILAFLPTGISWALRSYVFKWVIRNGLQDSFEKNLTLQYWGLLRHVPVLSKYLPDELPARLIKTNGFIYIEVAMQIQIRRIVHVVLRVDTLDGFYGSGSQSIDGGSAEIQRRIENAKTRVEGFPGLDEGMSIVVFAGYGRGNHVNIEFSEDWLAIGISVQDLEALSWNPDTNSSTIYRFTKHEMDLVAHGILLINPNGLLNFFGWWKRNQELFVPLQVDLSGKENLIVIPTDCIAEVRITAGEAMDRRLAEYIDGTLKFVRRKHITNYFESSKGNSLYVSETDVYLKQFLGCSITTRSVWWVGVRLENKQVGGDLTFRLWDAAHDWVELTSRVLEKEFPNINRKVVLFDIDLGQLVKLETLTKETPNSPLYDLMLSGSSTIRIILKQPFLTHLHNPVNVSERALVRAFIEGFSALAELRLDSDAISTIVSKIVENDAQRHIHFFEAKSFRQTMGAQGTIKSEVIDRSDFSLLRIGLGHFKTSGEKSIIGRKPCTVFLGELVDHIYAILKKDIVKFKRTPLVFRLTKNIEAITAEKDVWRRTTRAMLSLHTDGRPVFEGKTKHFSKLTTAEITSRILIEIALCESPSDSGLEITDLDLSPLLAKASLLFQFGNISDGINKGIIAPEVYVAPNGDVRTETTFQDEVLFNFVSNHEEEETKTDAATYEKHFEANNNMGEDYFSRDFLEVFSDETGATLEDIRLFLELIEDIGFDRNLDVYVIKHGSVIFHANEKKVAGQACIKRILNAFCLSPRERWDIPPENFKFRDIQPWSFRRRLSMYFRPILQLDQSLDPDYVISPGFCRDAFAYILDTYHRSFIDPEWCRSTRMKEWLGKEALRRGTMFTKEVGAVLESLGFNVRLEVQISSIIPESLQSNTPTNKFGDLDIIAWRGSGPDVFLIECKSLMIAKTFGEIGEQLQEFKGEVRNGVPDRLKRHIDRIGEMKKNSGLLKQYLQLDQIPKITPYVIFSRSVPILFVKSLPKEIMFSYLALVKESGLKGNA